MNQERLSAVVAAMAGRRVMVLADLVADEFLVCRTSRVSREAPAAMILRYERRELRPGGGANAVANLRSLGAEVDVIGAVGEDSAGEELLEQLREIKVNCDGILVDAGYRTVVKSRVMTSLHHSTKQQVLRIDREDVIPDSGRAPETIRERALASVDGADAVLVSDYGYGAASPAIATPVGVRAKGRGIQVTLDSRYRLLQHRGLTAVTPNEPEVEAALGVEIGDDIEALTRSGNELRRRLEAEAVIITRGSKGMAVFDSADDFEQIPVFGGDEIADVTGAGDTVIAAFTLALAAGSTHREAAQIANVAGGIVVMKMGTATVSADELAAAVRGLQ